MGICQHKAQRYGTQELGMMQESPLCTNGLESSICESLYRQGGMAQWEK